MADQATQTTHAVIEIDPHSLPAEKDHSFLTPDMTMVVLTWVTFLLLLAVLYKFAWKPILTALDTREKDIRDAIDHADKIKAEMERLSETSKQIIGQAETEAKELLTNARKAALEAAKTIEQKTRTEAQILIENANREIKEEKEKAQAELRAESARIAVDLAGKLIEKNLDDKQNREFVDQLIKDI